MRSRLRENLSGPPMQNHSGLDRRVLYPVFPPDRNAADVIAWLARRGT